MKKPIVAGFRHVGIIVRDMEASLRFYRDLLGLEVLQDFWDDTEYINTITGLAGANVHMIKLETGDGMVVELLEYVTHPTKLIPQAIHNVGCCHIALRVDDIDGAYVRLSEAEVYLVSEPMLSSEGIAKVCFCLDPNNVRLELVEMVS